MFNVFKKKDPVCGMKEEKGRGLKEQNQWFCSEHCRDEYLLALKDHKKKMKQQKGSCCD